MGAHVCESYRILQDRGVVEGLVRHRLLHGAALPGDSFTSLLKYWHPVIKCKIMFYFIMIFFCMHGKTNKFRLFSQIGADRSGKLPSGNAVEFCFTSPMHFSREKHVFCDGCCYKSFALCCFKLRGLQQSSWRTLQNGRGGQKGKILGPEVQEKRLCI